MTTIEIIKSQIFGLNYRAVQWSTRNGALFMLWNQVGFFVACDFSFDQRRLTSLYCLLFYSVMAYLFFYLKELFFGAVPYEPYVMISERTNVRHLALTATKLVLDFTKAVSFIITGVSAFLTFGVHQNLHDFSPSWTYLAVTGIYYLLTEPKFQFCWHKIVLTIEEPIFDEMIAYQTTFLTSCLTMMVSVSVLLNAFTIFGLHPRKYLWMLLPISTNIFLGVQTIRLHWKKLEDRNENLGRVFRWATSVELKNFKKDVCAICLQTMENARVTPCGHLFHNQCLKLVVKTHKKCPMCKQTFLQKLYE